MIVAVALGPTGEAQAKQEGSPSGVLDVRHSREVAPLGPRSRHGRSDNPDFEFPVLYRACRKANGSLKTCAQAVALSRGAMSEANRYGQSRAQNSFRHFIWQAALTARFGSRVAAAMGNRWEQGQSDLDSEVDLLNNSVGRMFGQLLSKEIREGLRDRYPWSYLHDLWFGAYEGHLLWVEMNRRVVPSCMKRTKDFRCVPV